MLDFCYFLNASVLLQSLTCSMGSDTGFCSSWFKSNYMMSHGPIALAILTWQNSIVFHSLDKMTSFFIHIMPVTGLSNQLNPTGESRTESYICWSPIYPIIIPTFDLL